MKLCKVVIPFTDKITGKLHMVDEEIAIDEQRLADIKAVNINMVMVLGDAPEQVEKPKRSRKK